jgi:hypothetical protein
VSVLPTLTGAAGQAGRGHFCWELPSKGALLQAVRAGDWKLVRDGATVPPELYDLAADPGEATDLAARRPEVAARLGALLATCHTPPEKP